MNCLVQIKEAENSFTSTEKMIAHYILKHTFEVLDYSAQVLAEKSQTSPAAVIRFSKKLGYKGFSELKMSLARSKNDYEENIDTVVEETDDLSTLIHKCCQLNISTVQKTYQMINDKVLNEAIELLQYADTVYLFGVGSSSVVANDLSIKLIRVGKKVIFNSDIHVQMTFVECMKKNDAGVLISYSGKTRGLTDIAKKLKENQIPTISITQNSKNFIAKNANINLFVPSEENELRIGAISSRTSSLVVTDLLYYGVFKHDLLNNKNKLLETKKLVLKI